MDITHPQKPNEPAPILFVKEGRELYGAERATVRLLRELDPKLFQPHVLVLEYGPEPSEFARALKEAGVANVAAHGRRELKRKLREVVAAQNIRIVCSIGYKCHILCHLACRGLNVMKLAVLHGWVRRGLKLRLYTAVAEKLLYDFDGVLTVSPQLAGEIKVKNGRAACIGNGVDPDELERLAAIDAPVLLPTAKPLLLYVGRLEPEKGLLDLLKAFASLKDQAHLALIGAGPQEAELRAAVGRLGLSENVSFTGYLENPLPLIRQATLLTLPSYTEGTPLVVLEAMALGTAVIATNVGGTPEVVDDGESGLLTPARQPDVLREAIEWLLDDAELRATMVTNARKRVVAEFSQSAVARRFEMHVLEWLS